MHLESQRAVSEKETDPGQVRMAGVPLTIYPQTHSEIYKTEADHLDIAFLESLSKYFPQT